MIITITGGRIGKKREEEEEDGEVVETEDEGEDGKVKKIKIKIKVYKRDIATVLELRFLCIHVSKF